VYVFEDRDERSLERIARSAESDVLVFGHTHKPWTRTISGVVMVNAGSTGKPKDGDPRACWVKLEISSAGVVGVAFNRVEYDVATMAQAIRDAQGLPDQFARDLETGDASQ
jgi:predicted phosphodiesterase